MYVVHRLRHSRVALTANSLARRHLTCSRYMAAVLICHTRSTEREKLAIAIEAMTEHWVKSSAARWAPQK